MDLDVSQIACKVVHQIQISALGRLLGMTTLVQRITPRCQKKEFFLDFLTLSFENSSVESHNLPLSHLQSIMQVENLDLADSKSDHFILWMRNKNLA
ncbi:hypothetical protein AQUCO_01500367v1 [Aquilegia coerulea]|uniref:Uncharacterized protein n=1 Tax=Aquilegia coerulea TaxID=218851 RepID=A0A2G5DTD7_AQUCA|nr:hypothetical protein AQUCO_01500367v1 [Aquilegia coerulea]